MGLVSRERRVATTISLLFLAASVVCALGSFAFVVRESLWKSALGVLVTLAIFAIFAVTAAQTRRIRAAGNELLVTTLFGTKRLSIDAVSLGIRATVTRGHANCHLYALDSAREVALLTTSSKRRGEGYQEQLTEMYLSGPIGQGAASRGARGSATLGSMAANGKVT